jgi:outer membrane protein
MTKSIFFPVALLFPLLATAQAGLMTADEAVQVALERNYSIRIMETVAEEARLNNTKANAGMVPTINLVANENATVSAFRQELANGNEFNALGAFFNTANAGFQLNWTLFDGRRMYLAKERLATQALFTDYTLQSTVQQTVAAVLQTYYGIAASRQQEKAIEEVIALNDERLRIAEARLAAGFAAQTDALQARIDLNQRLGDLIIQQNTTLMARRALNLLLARDPDTAFEVDENLENAYLPNRELLLQGLQQINPELLALQTAEQVASIMIGEAESQRKLRLNLSGQLSAQRTDNTSGFLLNNTQSGLTGGLSLLLPIYDGGLLKSRIATARVGAARASMQSDARQMELVSQLDNQLSAFNTQQQVLRYEESNVLNARQSLDISIERFRLGQTNSLEVQQAQSAYEQALARRNLIRFTIKQAEVQLRLLAGQL